MARKKLETLTEQMYYVLLSLMDETRHGYGIMQHVSQLTNNRITIGAGTLYALLSRFEEEELITLTQYKEGRKYYALSRRGKEVFTEEYARLRRQVADGAALLGREENL